MPLGGACAALVLLGLAQLYLTWLIKEWVEGPLLTNDRTALLTLAVKFTATIVVAALALFGSRYQISVVNRRLVARLRNRAVERLLSLELSTVRQFSRGDIVARLLTDAEALSKVLSVVFRRVVRDVVIYVGASVMMFVLNWQLTLAAALMLPVLAWLIIRIGQRIRRWQARGQADVGQLGATLSEQLHGFTTIKGYRAEAFEQQRFAVRNAETQRQLTRSDAWFAALMASILLVTGVQILAVLSYATLLRGQGDGYGALLAFCLYGVQLVPPLRGFGETQGLFQQMLASADRVFELIDQPVPDPHVGRPLTRPVRGRVAFDRVEFAYDAQAPVLVDFSLVLEPGERVGLVGATGSGKSTVARLLLRHLHPSAGTITLDDQDVATVPLVDLRQAVSVVEQEPFLFDGPVLDNIRYGTWDASDEAIDAAVRMTGLDGLIPRLPRGLHTSLSEAQLSGGEKQRIALARAVVKGAPVLVLDEATTAIDGELEAEMFARLDDWLVERTVVVIGHRYATVRRCPRIVVLEAGRIIGDGAATDLLRTCPRFTSMFADQLGADTASPTAAGA